MRAILLTTLLGSALFMSGCIGAGQISSIEKNGEGYLPTLTGIDLHGEEREIPQSFKGDLNIVAVAFQREQQDDIDTWIPEIEGITKQSDKIKFYELPLICELNMANRMFVNNGMRSGIEDKEARTRTITVYTSREEFLELMNMNEEHIYILLLNKNGKILWQHKGAYDQNAFQDLQKIIRDTQK